MDVHFKTIEFADFAANLLKILDDLDQGLAPGFEIVRDGRLVATLRPPRKSLHGLLRDTVRRSTDLDLTEPMLIEETHAESGRVHE